VAGRPRHVSRRAEPPQTGDGEITPFWGRFRQPHPGSRGQVAEAAGAGVPVHPGTAPVAQQRPVLAAVDGPVDGPPDRGRQRDEDDLGALADHAQDAVAVLLAEVGDVGGAGLEDPQPEQAERGDQGEVLTVGRLAGGQQRLELQVVSPSVGDSGGTVGRRSHCAGECSSRPSMTQVR